MLSIMRRSTTKRKKGILTGRTPPWKSGGVSGVATTGSKECVADLRNGKLHRGPQGSQLLPRVTSVRKRKVTEKFNPTVLKKGVNMPTHNGWDRKVWGN